ncbi:MAG: matrixin family metalloprotease [Acholeplasmataceae bacterium]|jgi:hypothetical protein|nr:matrixin family metalloprotease [Acholeplasmataceae bacterium]
MKKYISLVLVIIMISLNLGRHNLNLDKKIIFVHPIYTDNAYIINYQWTGRIIDSINLESNHDSKIPITFFLVEVENDYTDSLDDVVVIGFFGGYVGDILYLLEDMAYPKLDVSYNFYNASLIEISGYKVLLVSTPHHMIESEILNFSSIASLNPIEDDDGSGSGGVPYENTNFQTAVTLDNPTVITNLSILIGIPRYYKFTTQNITTIVASTTGNTDVTLTLYNSNQTILKFNDDIIFTDKNSSVFLENALSGTYYLKIERKTIGPSENIGLQLEWLLPSLVVPPTSTQLPSANSKNQVIYKDLTNTLDIEISYAASIWNRLSTNKILAESPSLSATVEISIAYIEDPEVAGIYIYSASGLSTIELSVTVLDEYSGTNNINYRVNIIAHELGHALGIEHTPNNRNIMHNILQPRLALGVYDIIYFSDIWG